MELQQQAKRGGGATRTNAVAAGSVWETRMKMDQVMGGFKVFNGDPIPADPPEEPKAAAAATQRKRRSWKQPEPERDPIEIRRALSQLARAEEPAETAAVDIGVCSGGERKGFDDKEVDFFEEKKKIDKIRDVPVSSLEVAPTEVEEDFEDSLEQQRNRLQGVVDLVMWRDITRSAFAFGTGSFLLIFTSYAGDLGFSMISAVSYASLLYLVMVFLYESFFSRETEQSGESDERWAIGEEDVIWVIKMGLPYINEVLPRLRRLFSGDPAMTMKLAVILFGIGKCGQITLWTMSKLAFFGLFTIPRLWDLHSDRIRRYGMLLLERMRHAWATCNYKKVVAITLFTLFWNLSSVISRLWAVFMLLVLLRYYDRHLLAVAGRTETGDAWEKLDNVAETKTGSVSVGGRAPARVGSVQRAAAGGGSLHRHTAGPARPGGGEGEEEGLGKKWGEKIGPDTKICRDGWGL